MAFLANGVNITAGWATTPTPTAATTGYKESGTDLGDKYAECGVLGQCSSGGSPVCETIPSTYKRNGATITQQFWTGVCT